MAKEQPRPTDIIEEVSQKDEEEVTPVSAVTDKIEQTTSELSLATTGFINKPVPETLAAETPPIETDKK